MVRLFFIGDCKRLDKNRINKKYYRIIFNEFLFLRYKNRKISLRPPKIAREMCVKLYPAKGEKTAIDRENHAGDKGGCIAA